MNNLLTFGRVPFLFSTEEVDQVIELISSAEDEEWPIWTGGGGSVGTPDCRSVIDFLCFLGRGCFDAVGSCGKME